MRTKIYALLNPEGEIRYIGKTYRNLRTRFSQHLSEARFGKSGHRCKWIRSLFKKGTLPSIQFIGEIEGDGIKEEIAWIAYFKEEGVNLTNDTDGGEGMLGHKPSDATKKKMSIGHKGQVQWNVGMKMPQWYCDKLAVAQKKRFSNPEERIRVGLAGKGHVVSKESREKARVSNTGHEVSEAARKKISVSLDKFWESHPEARDEQRVRLRDQRLLRKATA